MCTLYTHTDTDTDTDTTNTTSTDTTSTKTNTNTQTNICYSKLYHRSGGSITQNYLKSPKIPKTPYFVLKIALQK